MVAPTSPHDQHLPLTCKHMVLFRWSYNEDIYIIFRSVAGLKILVCEAREESRCLQRRDVVERDSLSSYTTPWLLIFHIATIEL